MINRLLLIAVALLVVGLAGASMAVILLSWGRP